MIEPINPSLWRSANRNTARAARRGSGLRLPTSQRFVGEPNREASTIAKRCVIVTPVRHSMPLTWNVASALGMEFERHDRSSRWQRRSSVPKLLKRPPRPYPCTKVAPAPLQGLQHYYGSIRPSPLHRYSRLAVFAACASPLPSGAGSCSSAQKPMSDSRPLYAGRRPPSHQAPGGLVPEEIHAPGFDDACFLTTRLRRVHCHS